MDGIWKHHEIFDGTYSFKDLCDVHELLDIKIENENRRIAFEEQNREG